MAVDKIVDGTALDNNLTSVANAIRTKGGTSGSLSFPSGFVSAINAMGGSITYSAEIVVDNHNFPVGGTASYTIQSNSIDCTKIGAFAVIAQSTDPMPRVTINKTSGFVSVGDVASNAYDTLTITGLTSSSITFSLSNSQAVVYQKYILLGKAR